MKLIGIGLSLLVTVVLLVACGANELTTNKVPAEFVSYEDRLRGFSISFPKTWRNLPPNEVRYWQEITETEFLLNPPPAYDPNEEPLPVTDLWFIAERVSVEGLQEVRIFEDVLSAEAGQKFNRRTVRWLKDLFEGYNFEYIKQEFGTINGFDAAILDYTYDIRAVGPPQHGTQRMVSLHAEYVTVVCIANRLEGVEELVAVPMQEWADTCWDILKSFRLER